MEQDEKEREAVKRTKPSRPPFVDRATSLHIDDDAVIVDTLAVRQAKGIWWDSAEGAGLEHAGGCD